MDKKLKVNNINDWEYFANAYLELSLIGLQKAADVNDKEDVTEKFIIIPSLFSFKHGIEIMLKTFSISFLKKDYLDKSDLNHDIHEIFKRLKQSVTKKEFEAASVNTMKRYTEISEEEVSYENVFNELERIVLKYINLDVLKTKIESGDLCFEDLSNDALRYPSNNLSVQLNYESLVKKIQHREILEIMSDCTKAKINLWKFLVIEMNRES
jgi:hypothetical protein